MFTSKFQAWVRRLAMRLMERAAELPVTPNQLTVAGLGITTMAAALVALDHPFYGGFVLLFAGVFDIFDGALARATGRSYPYGAFLDSTTDRYAEFVVMLAVLVYFQRHGQSAGPALVLVALAGSLLVSYVRARAQSLGFTCDGGLLARPERVLLTVVGLLLAPVHVGGLLAVVWIMAIFTNVTAAQRVFIVWRQSRRGGSSPSTAPSETARANSSDVPRPALLEGGAKVEVRPGPEPAGG